MADVLAGHGRYHQVQHEKGGSDSEDAVAERLHPRGAQADPSANFIRPGLAHAIPNRLGESLPSQPGVLVLLIRGPGSRKMASVSRPGPSITTTLDPYGHLYPGEMDRYTDRADEAADGADAAR